MRFKGLSFVTVAVMTALISACGGGADNANPANTANTGMPAKTPVVEQVTNNAPTLTPVFKEYCAAWKNNDEKALRAVYSADTIKSFEEQMKDDNFKSKKITEFLQDERVMGDLCEVINEEITGDRGVGTIKTNAMPRGVPIEFLKEGGSWKLTNKTANPESITRQAANLPAANTAK
ncbi:MAG: hypothetical protein WKF34_02705 [Pyrinomonadaceae bacterium]